VKLETVRFVVTLALVVTLPLALSPNPGLAAPAAIGTVVASGSFRVDDATVAGNATLFEGTTVETRRTGSSLDLSGGPHLALAPDSKGKVFGDRLILEKGVGEFSPDALKPSVLKTSSYRIEARGLTIQAAGAGSSARVSLDGERRVRVAAFTGGVRVLNRHGLLVAALRPGSALEFEPQVRSSGSEPWKMTGCLRFSGGHYMLTDETTNVTAELAGSKLGRERGNRVEITGSADPASIPVSGATRYVRVSQVHRLGKGCAAGTGGAIAAASGGRAAAGGAAGRATAGGAAAGGTAGATATGAGAATISTTTIAIIGGVAAAATVGGLAATDTLPGQGGGSGSTVSR
jgi:hypothetical protein